MRLTTFLATAALILTGLVESKTVRYDCQTTPQICLNTCWAINCAKNVKTLNGGNYKNAAAARRGGAAKRTEWGYGSKPCKKGGRWAWTAPSITGGKRKNQYNKRRAATSPEEYPYASSAQGGLKWKGKTVSLRCVPSLEQSVQGGLLKGIGLAKKSEKINMVFNNISKMPKGSPNWCTKKPKCKNDGHQFTASKKANFLLAKNYAKRDLEDLEQNNSTVVDDVDLFFEDDEFDDEFDLEDGEEDAGLGMVHSPDGDSAAISARWTEDGWVPTGDDE